jgi:hybrid cluster-associated redox disulfide protein
MSDKNSGKGKEIKITKDTMIAEVLKAKPQAAGIFFAYGMPCLGCSVGLNESVEAAASVHGANLDELLIKLNEA